MSNQMIWISKMEKRNSLNANLEGNKWQWMDKKQTKYRLKKYERWGKNSLDFRIDHCECAALNRRYWPLGV